VAAELALVLAVRELVLAVWELVLVAELVLAVRELVAVAVMEWDIPFPAHILVRSRFTQTGWERKRFIRGRQTGDRHSDLGVGLPIRPHVPLWPGCRIPRTNPSPDHGRTLAVFDLHPIL
jgi:hypothetical protein